MGLAPLADPAPRAVLAVHVLRMAHVALVALAVLMVLVVLVVLVAPVVLVVAREVVREVPGEAPNSGVAANQSGVDVSARNLSLRN